MNTYTSSHVRVHLEFKTASKVELRKTIVKNRGAGKS